MMRPKSSTNFLGSVFSSKPSCNVLHFGRNFSSNIRFSGNKDPISASKENEADFIFENSESVHDTILQFTDLHFYNNGSREDEEGIKLIRTLSQRVRPNLVVFTGDIIDGRYCGSFDCFLKVIQPLIDLGIPWTYIPGNHDDETNLYSRKDLLSLLSLPMCASRNQETFNHHLRMGSMQIYLLDSHGYLHPPSVPVAYDFIKKEQIDWYNQCAVSDAHVGLAFFHIPLQEYKQAQILRGSWGEEPCTPIHNSGFFQAMKRKKDIDAVFVGHDHWNDFVSQKDGIWLCYGRVSGFTYSTSYGDFSSPANKERGGRVIRYHPSLRILSTWVENLRGIERNSVVSKGISRENFSLLE